MNIQYIHIVSHTDCHLVKRYLFIIGLKSVLGSLKFDGGNNSADLAAISAFSLPLIPV